MPDTTHAFTVRTADEIRESGLRCLRNGLAEIGVDAPNVSPNSDDYCRFNAFANELSVCEANGAAKADELMPDTAVGDGLKRWLEPNGIEYRPASGSVGTVILDASQTTAVPLGTRIVDGTGQLFEVSTGGTYDDEDEVPIAAISTGDATNLPGGTVLRWVAPPAFCASTAVISDAGLVNGTDEDNDDIARARLFAHWQEAPSSGNSTHVAEIAEASTSSVEKAYVYPAAQGPGTYHVAVTARPTATNKSRAVADAKISTVVRPYVTGQLPEHTEGTITSVEDVETDVSILVSLPSSPAASPPGPGGGWLDGTPWPAYPVEVQTVTSSTSFKIVGVDGTGTVPTEGVTRISWLSHVDWTVKTATVTSATPDGPLAYDIIIDTPFDGIEVDDRVWPACENQDAYAEAILEGFAALGPGEKTDNTLTLARAFRHPIPAQSYPYELGAQLLSKLSQISEVYAAQFKRRYDGTKAVVGASGSFAPEVPAAITDKPLIFIPKRIAFYPL